MLKNIDPLLTGDLLKILADMGHGDELAIVDANFPAFEMGKAGCGTARHRRAQHS